MVIENSVSVKSRLNEQVKDYLMSLHANNEDTKKNYGGLLGSFVDFLANRGITRFEDASKIDIGQFLSTKQSQNTKNLFIFVIKNFYTDYLVKEELVRHECMNSLGVYATTVTVGNRFTRWVKKLAQKGPKIPEKRNL